MEKIGTHIFTVQPFEVDFKRRLTLPLLINNLLNTAGHHADARGFGMKHINLENHTWVLSRLALELSRLPQEGETVKIQTWIEGVMRSFTQRNFQIDGEGGETIGYARTVWAMIDMETRKPVSLAGQTIEQYICDKTCPIGKPGKILPPQGNPSSSFIVKYSDLDINKHLNSAKYVEHIMDELSIEEINEKEITRFEIEYAEECRFGERINVTKASDAEKGETIILSKEGGDTACKCKIRFS